MLENTVRLLSNYYVLYLEVGIMVEICLSIKSSNAHRNNILFYLFYPP